MHCPFCQSANVNVVDSRPRDGGTSIWRRRECLSCSKRFSSREKIDFSYLSVIKRGGKKEAFSREKILMSMFKSIGKRPIPEASLEKIVDEISQEIHKNGKTEIKSSEIGMLVLKKLHKIDLVAYIRFASVYKGFKNIDAFKKELENIEHS